MGLRQHASVVGPLVLLVVLDFGAVVLFLSALAVSHHGRQGLGSLYPAHGFWVLCSRHYCVPDHVNVLGLLHSPEIGRV